MGYRISGIARSVTHEIYGVVVSSGLMQRTVKVRVGGKVYDPKVHRTMKKPKHYLVHDPNSSLLTGDVVSIVPGWRTSRHKRHVVKQIVAPAGVPIEERAPISTLEERIAEYEDKKRRKDERRRLRREAEEGGGSDVVAAEAGDEARARGTEGGGRSSRMAKKRKEKVVEDELDVD